MSGKSSAVSSLGGVFIVSPDGTCNAIENVDNQHLIYGRERVEGNEPLKGSRELGQNRLVQSGVTISDGIYTANSLHLDCKIL